MGASFGNELLSPLRALAQSRPHWKSSRPALEIWVDRGDGKGSVFLAIDTIPDYLDTAPLPAPGAAAGWKNKAIYRRHDQPAGQWSDELRVGVTGA